MGGKVPVPDARLQKTIDEFRLEKKHVRKFWRAFRKYDKDKSGTIDLEEFYDMVGEKPSIFGDNIFELIDVDGSSGLEFSEFVAAVMTYCMFGKVDILKFCFYIFDKDRNGFIEEDELQDLVSILHSDGTNSNVTDALAEFDTNKDGRVTFSELKHLNATYPQILFPAFRMQHGLQHVTLGNDFFFSRKQQFHDERVELKNEEGRADAELVAKRDKLRAAAVKKEMGALKYYCCPAQRGSYLAKVLPALEPEKDEEEDPSNTTKHRTQRGHRGRKSGKTHSNSETKDRRDKKRDDLGRSRRGKKEKKSHKMDGPRTKEHKKKHKKKHKK